QACPDLAGVLPTVQTGRGFHVYFVGDFARTVVVGSGDLHEGELRGSGIATLPPSKHATGAVYRWTVPLPDGPIPAVDAVKAGLLPDEAVLTQATARSDVPVQQRRQRQRRRQSKRKTTEKTEDMKGGVCERNLPEERIAEILRSTQPHGPGQRNRAVFELARTLRGEPGLYDADPCDFRSIVKAWHKLALPVIRTKPFEETWIDFLQAWPKVKYPKGAGPMDVIFERATAAKLPAEAMQYEQPQVRLLVSLCRELQRHTGERPFYLGCRTAGRLLDVHHKTAWRWLLLLAKDGILCVSEKGGLLKNRFRATRFFYVPEDAT
ncbi:MAG: bifunctional DNA primase/polymerase, partial [Planctomycetota bacterium]